MKKATVFGLGLLAVLSVGATNVPATTPPPEPDFGDAPDSYGTLLASDGARHEGVFFNSLGPVVDGESDGQPGPLADGDDLAGLPDDEDGVVLTSLSAGGTGMAIVDGGPAGGMLDGWIDFNGNGVFDHPVEHLWGGVSQSLLPGTNPPLQFPILLVAVPGPTYARFRLSIDGGLLPTGPAPDGEVEDYLCEIEGLSATEKASWGWMKSLFRD